MKIEIRMAVDNATGHPYWTGKIINADTVVIEAVSKTFHPNAPDKLFMRRLQTVCDYLTEEVGKIKDRRALISLFTTN